MIEFSMYSRKNNEIFVVYWIEVMEPSYNRKRDSILRKNFQKNVYNLSVENNSLNFSRLKRWPLCFQSATYKIRFLFMGTIKFHSSLLLRFSNEWQRGIEKLLPEIQSKVSQLRSSIGGNLWNFRCQVMGWLINLFHTIKFLCRLYNTYYEKIEN